MTEPLASLSDALEAHAARGLACVAGLDFGGRFTLSAIQWRPGVLVTSEQSLPEADSIAAILPGGARAAATLAGRDPTTNIAVLRIDGGATTPASGEVRGIGGLVLAIGSDGEGGGTARMGVVERAGPAWDSRRGGRIDAMIRIGVRLGAGAEGGPVLDARGALLGMSTFGPRRGVMVIPASTIARIVDPLLAQGRIVGGWLGAGLHSVALTPELGARAGLETGLMVVSIAPDSPASACLLPGDILLEIAGRVVASPRAVAAALGGETIGQMVELKLLRGGEILRVGATVAARPQ